MVPAEQLSSWCVGFLGFLGWCANRRLESNSIGQVFTPTLGERGNAVCRVGHCTGSSHAVRTCCPCNTDALWRYSVGCKRGASEWIAWRGQRNRSARSDGRNIQILASFFGLTAPDTASHIHCCQTMPGTNVGVATTVPAFAGFPLGMTQGTYLSPLF